MEKVTFNILYHIFFHDENMKKSQLPLKRLKRVFF